jgi:hypothetical protein
MVSAVYLRTLVVAIAALTALLVVPPTPAHATPTSPPGVSEIEAFETECFDESGEFEGTGGCFKWAEENIEIDNLLESIQLGCSLNDMYEDYSCRGPSSPSSSLAYESEAADCFVVDLSSLSEQEVIALQSLGFYGLIDGELRSPQCADGEFIGAFPDDVAQARLVEELG